MKKQLLVSMFSTSFVFGQTAQSHTKEQEISNAEKFSSKAGTLLQKEFFEIGEVKGCKLTIIHYTNLIGTLKTSSLKFEYEYSRKCTSDTKAAVLDVDEIDDLIKSITMMQEKIFQTTPSTYTEVSFKSRGGFDAGCFSSTGTWSTYLKLEKFDKDSYVWLTKEDFPTLLNLLQQAKV